MSNPDDSDYETVFGLIRVFCCAGLILFAVFYLYPRI